MNKKDISKEEFLGILSMYKTEETGIETKAVSEVDIEYDLLGPIINMELYYETNEEGNTKRSPVTRNDVNIALSKYAEELGEDLISFKYIGGVRRIGLFLEQNQAHFDGVRLKLRERELVRKLKPYDK